MNLIYESCLGQEVMPLLQNAGNTSNTFFKAKNDLFFHYLHRHVSEQAPSAVPAEVCSNLYLSRSLSSVCHTDLCAPLSWHIAAAALQLFAPSILSRQEGSNILK